MGIEWFRDLSITILGFVTTAVLIFMSVILYRLYGVAKPTLLSIQAASQSVSDTATLVQEGIRPLLLILALIEGIRGGFSGIRKIYKQATDIVDTVKEETCGVIDTVRNAASEASRKGHAAVKALKS